MATGGGAASDVTLQLRADVFGMNVLRPENEEAGTLGCMLLAALGTGAYLTLSEGIHRAVRMKKVFEPNFETRTYIMQKYEKYRALYEKMHDFI